MRKAGMIPETADEAAFNQWVFPAEEGERLISKIKNSVHLNKVQHVLGCSVTQAEVLAKHGLITSTLPIACEEIGQTQGQFNLNDLAQFMEKVFRETRNYAAETEGFVKLTAAAKGTGSAAEILQWQLRGRLAGTRLLNGIQRLDHLRFDIELIKTLAKDRRGPDLNRITVVATTLGIKPNSVKKLLVNSMGGPRLLAASASATSGLRGAAYVSTVEIERFLVEYTTLALIARQLDRHPTSVRRGLKTVGVAPTMDASSLGARIYRRVDEAAFIASQDTSPSVPPYNGQLATVDACGNRTVISGRHGDFGESDDVIL